MQIDKVSPGFFSPLLSLEECCKQFHLSHLVLTDASAPCTDREKWSFHIGNTVTPNYLQGSDEYSPRDHVFLGTAH